MSKEFQAAAVVSGCWSPSTSPDVQHHGSALASVRLPSAQNISAKLHNAARVSGCSFPSVRESVEHHFLQYPPW